jgi:S-adenosylmethionine hydrolase
VAGHLSLGVKAESFGDEIASWSELSIPKTTIKEKKLFGEVFYIDRFGNLISNIDEKKLSFYAKGRSLIFRVGKITIHGLKKGYWEGKKGERIALLGSGGFLEISVREGDAQKMLELKKGDPIVVQINESPIAHNQSTMGNR